jgi:hypothetical protein
MLSHNAVAFCDSTIPKNHKKSPETLDRIKGFEYNKCYVIMGFYPLF